MNSERMNGFNPQIKGRIKRLCRYQGMYICVSMHNMRKTMDWESQIFHNYIIVNGISLSYIYNVRRIVKVLYVQ